MNCYILCKKIATGLSNNIFLCYNLIITFITKPEKLVFKVFAYIWLIKENKNNFRKHLKINA